MSLPRFAALESRVAALASTVFGNAHLVVNGSIQVTAVLDRGIAQLGEFDLTGERRDRISLRRADAATFAAGQTVAADHARYTAAEITAMGKSSWKLDRLDADDGHLVSWWLK